MTPLMQLGAQRFIVQEDLDDLTLDDSSGNLGRRLQHYWDKELAMKKKYVLSSSQYPIPTTHPCLCAPSHIQALPLARAVILIRWPARARCFPQSIL